MTYSVVTRPGTCIQDGEDRIPLDRVIRIISQLPPGEHLLVISDHETGDRS